MTKDYEEIRKFAQSKGWHTLPYCSVGHICRWCHKEIIAWGYTEHAWASPKYTLYHTDCAIERFKEKYKNILIKSGQAIK